MAARSKMQIVAVSVLMRQLWRAKGGGLSKRRKLERRYSCLSGISMSGMGSIPEWQVFSQCPEYLPLIWLASPEQALSSWAGAQQRMRWPTFVAIFLRRPLALHPRRSLPLSVTARSAAGRLSGRAATRSHSGPVFAAYPLSVRIKFVNISY